MIRKEDQPGASPPTTPSQGTAPTALELSEALLMQQLRSISLAEYSKYLPRGAQEDERGKQVYRAMKRAETRKKAILKAQEEMSKGGLQPTGSSHSPIFTGFNTIALEEN